MRGINLARRPFLNRRPILRLAGLLWLIGAALLILNVWLFSGHWQGTAVNRQRLIEANREIRELDEELRAQDQALARVDIRRQNRQTARLNSLINYRTFPWSALFDDLEDVVPLDVRLTSVRPEVHLKEPKKPRRRTSSSPTSGTGDAPPAAAASRRGAEDETLRRDEVKLRLAAAAKSEEALMELIDTLYASPYFRGPFLPGEVLNLASGSSSGSVSVIYLTRPASPGGEAEDGATGEASPEPPSGAPSPELPSGTPSPELPSGEKDETEETAAAAAAGSEA